jgi:bifunctional non-homologous end joining protein LigD
MSLEVYKKKRDFKRTPEPVSGKKTGKSALTFVVQRHNASHLHYDFRLEMEGVLKSWAVPKGPSMVAGEKRLAMMVEDHPLAYGKFYGVIPEGNYGAGTVEIWDEGTYKPIEEKGDPEKTLLAQLYKGNIKFIMDGTYLKGEFALVHFHGKKENEWLLIKKEDEFSVPDFDIEKVQPIKSELIRKEKPEKKSKNQQTEAKQKVKEPAPKEKFPEIPHPMLAKLSEQVIDYPDWIYETKYDGYRLVSGINEGNAELMSRNGISFNEKYKPIADELQKVEESVILDGEIVIEDSKGISDFQLLQNYNLTHEGTLKYYVFDILYLNGHSVTDFPQLKRKELLNMFFKKYKLENIFNSPYQIGKGKEFFEKLSAKGYEGVIAKNPESIYAPDKRTDAWLKVKTNKMQEAIICGYTLPQKSRKYIGSLILGLYENGKLKYIGNCGTGFNETSLKDLHTRFEEIKTDVCPFNPKPKFTGPKGKAVWLKPELVCNVKFFEWSDDDQMRHPVFMGLREDKASNEVVNESKMGTKEKGQEAEKVITIDGKEVKCTHLTKVYWPDEGYTKGDLIAYYQTVSKYILPYLKDRPQSLNRHPNGIKAQGFYQKNMESNHQLPEWIKTVKLYSKSNEADIEYLICNDEATLIYMANLGCIEINPWHSTYQNPDNPTYMMLDLDPGNISFGEVVNTALAIKEVSDEIKVPCFCKTSGATGLHIYFPFGGQYDYDQLRAFAEILAVIVHNRLPSTTSIERSVSKRKDKIYIDFMQNSKGQTIAAPYSVRPRPLATVSTPLLWNEVNHQLSPEQFTIKNMIQRLKKTGDIWRPVIKEGIDLNNVLKVMEKLK